MSGREPGLGATAAMTFDVEEWFQVWAMRPHVARGDWDAHPSRVEASVDRLLEALDEHDAQATFFTLGWIAERHAAMLRRIVGAGHELASHGYDHQLVHEQCARQFEEDVRLAKTRLEQAAGVAVTGYRAANFSIDRRTPWAHEVLGAQGYRYSSSSHPVRNDHYGDDRAERLPHRAGPIVEIPVTTLRLFDRNWPCAGGGYFRLLPRVWTRHALQRVANAGERLVFYLHPWEIDPQQPRPSGLRWRTAVRHYTGLGSCLENLRALLAERRWGRVDTVFADVIEP
ncbi:MAG: DUF3473 domain-containing protein [Geminicoccaceae bacterium]|nr:DUF3473 domain-containing protein [Geminicoccaceae bacterium]